MTNRLEQQWFQIALKTYFWAGVLFAVVSCFSFASLAATVYYCNLAELRHKEMQREFLSYQAEIRQARETTREVGKIYYQMNILKNEIEEKINNDQ